MKKIYVSLFAIMMVSILYVSCSKDQKVVKQLDGTWKVTAMTQDGTAVPDSVYAQDKYEFKKCKVKKGDCDGVYTTYDESKGTFGSDFTYSVSDKGTKFFMTLTFFGQALPTIEYDIVEHSKSTFVISYTDEDGSVSETTMEKE